MSRFITNIKKTNLDNNQITVAILSAGNGSKIKTYEPRCLLKIKDVSLIDHQVKSINDHFASPEIICVVGCHANKVIRKIKNKLRIVENQIYDQTNSAESLRLAFNNSVNDRFMFCHGDILFNESTLRVSYNKSFVIIDSKKMIKDDEVGLTITDKKLSIMSYGLPLKWGQIAFFTGKEYKILKNIFGKFEDKDKKKLSFEVINEIIEAGGNFECYEPKDMKLLEIDRIKDIR